MAIVAICGPDGAGKTTIVDRLAVSLSREHPVSQMYGGKKSNHFLPTTTVALVILELMRRVPGLRRLARSYQALVFYPLEFLENWVRWLVARRRCRGGGLVLFDRFAVDRMWRGQVPTERRGLVKVNAGDYFFGWLYARFFPAADAYLFLLPSAEILFARAPGEFRSVEHASCVREAYARLARRLEAEGRNVHQLLFGDEETPDELAKAATMRLGI